MSRHGLDAGDVCVDIRMFEDTGREEGVSGYPGACRIIKGSPKEQLGSGCPEELL